MVNNNSITEVEFKYLITEFLGEEIRECEEYGYFEVTLNLKDVNFKINDIDWEKAIKEHLLKIGIEVKFSYGDGDWVTIHKK